MFTWQVFKTIDCRKWKKGKCTSIRDGLPMVFYYRIDFSSQFLVNNNNNQHAPQPLPPPSSTTATANHSLVLLLKIHHRKKWDFHRLPLLRETLPGPLPSRPSSFPASSSLLVSFLSASSSSLRYPFSLFHFFC